MARLTRPHDRWILIIHCKACIYWTFLVDLKDPDLQTLLAEWQHYYNWDRSHSSLEGKTPIERLNELSDKTLLWEEVTAKFDPSKERIQEQNYQDELALRKLK